MARSLAIGGGVDLVEGIGVEVYRESVKLLRRMSLMTDLLDVRISLVIGVQPQTDMLRMQADRTPVALLWETSKIDGARYCMIRLFNLEHGIL